MTNLSRKKEAPTTIEINYGIVAVNPDTDEVLHFVGMTHQPSDEDFDRVEATIDELEIINEEYDLRQATKAEVNRVNKRFKVEGNEIYYVH